MGRKSKYNKELKLEMVMKYKSGVSANELGENYSIPKGLVFQWTNQYNSNGESVFNNSPRNKRYSKEFKSTVVEEYNKRVLSEEKIINKYSISSRSVLKRWIRKYNSHIEITDYDPKPEVYLAKSRKTTYEERVKIVKYCLEHEQKYNDTAIQYGVNYTQVYTWVRKYKEQGEDGLLDPRGRTKLESDMTEEERFKHQLKRLEAKNNYLEMENKALKKLEEIERQMIKEHNKRQNIEQSKN